MMRTPPFRSNAHISGGGDSRQEAYRAMVDAPLFREFGADQDLHPGARDFAEMTVLDIASQFLRWQGFGADEVERMRSHDVLTRALDSDAALIRGYGTADFSALLRDRTTRLVCRGAAKAPVTYHRWARAFQVPNFRDVDFGSVDVGPLPKVQENGEPIVMPRRERVETVAAELYAAKLGLTRQAMINDDKDALVTTPLKIGAAAGLTVNQIVYDVLLAQSGTGPTLATTGAALFSTTHGNYESSGAAPAVATLSTLRRRMRLQTEPASGRPLNIPPKFLLVPPDLESEARVLAAADRLEGSDENLEVIVEAALRAGTNGTTAWYLLADGRELFDTFAVATLNRIENNQIVPVVEPLQPRVSDGSTSYDASFWRISISAAAVALDYRTMARNRGA